MAVSAIARVIMTLFKKHGIARGASMAQKLGFKNKDIKKAFSQLTGKRRASIETYQVPPMQVPRTGMQRSNERTSRVADRTDDFYGG